MGLPLDHVIVDIVGPLVHSASGYQYLLTIMCAATLALLVSTPVLAASAQGAGAVLLQSGADDPSPRLILLKEV